MSEIPGFLFILLLYIGLFFLAGYLSPWMERFAEWFNTPGHHLVGRSMIALVLLPLLLIGMALRAAQIGGERIHAWANRDKDRPR